jgi:hypothetical protein
MGTNYYLDTGEDADSEHCATCTCTEKVQLHICKSHRMFEGHFKDGEPWLTSWADWKAYLAAATGAGAQIVDEYGTAHDLDEFVADVEAVPTSDRRRQYDWVNDHGYRVGLVEPGHDWLDEAGYSFHGGEFS